jgi:H-NS histone family
MTIVEWEYRKILLNDHLRRGDDIELLCDAGKEGWELIAITPNSVAYLRRAINSVPAHQHTSHPTETAHANEAAAATKPKYRDPATGDTWSGRGRMATWLKHKQDAGEDIEKYRV